MRKCPERLWPDFEQNIQLIHPEKANVSKKEIKEALAKKLKSSEDKISVFGLKTQFGGGRSSGFALIYNTTEDKAKYDSETLLRRVSAKPSPGGPTQLWLSNKGCLACLFSFSLQCNL